MGRVEVRELRRKLKKEKDYLPHYVTINECLAKLEPSETVCMQIHLYLKYVKVTNGNF